MTRNADHRRGHGRLAAGALALALAGAGVSGEARAGDQHFCFLYANDVDSFLRTMQARACPSQVVNGITGIETAYDWCMVQAPVNVLVDYKARSAAAQRCGSAGATGATAGRTPPAPAPAAGGARATVNNDVDLYDVPGGNVIGMLMQGQTIGLTTCRGDNWCQVEGGWVWGDFLIR